MHASAEKDHPFGNVNGQYLDSCFSLRIVPIGKYYMINMSAFEDFPEVTSVRSQMKNVSGILLRTCPVRE